MKFLNFVDSEWEDAYYENFAFLRKIPSSSVLSQLSVILKNKEGINKDFWKNWANRSIDIPQEKYMELTLQILAEEESSFSYLPIKDLNELPIADQTVDVIVTERPYIGGNVKKYSAGSRVQTFETLCYAIGEIIHLAKTIGAEYKLIRPVDWKPYFKLTKKTSMLMQKSIREELTGVTDSEDIQDAILIGRYFLDHRRISEKD